MDNNILPNHPKALLAAACRLGNLKRVEEYLTQLGDPSFVLPDYLGGTTLLSIAINTEGPPHTLAKFLLDSGCNPNLPTLNGEYPLHEAAERDYVDLVKRLIAKGANPQQRDCKGRSPWQCTLPGRKTRTYLEQHNGEPEQCARLLEELLTRLGDFTPKPPPVSG